MKRTNSIKKTVAAILTLCMAAMAMTTLLTGCGAKQEADTAASAYYEYEASYSTEPFNSSMYYDESESLEFNTEEYNHIDETGFKSPLTSPLSTFSADVDTASYTNIRRVIADVDIYSRYAQQYRELLEMMQEFLDDREIETNLLVVEGFEDEDDEDEEDEECEEDDE